MSDKYVLLFVERLILVFPNRRKVNCQEENEINRPVLTRGLVY